MTEKLIQALFPELDIFPPFILFAFRPIEGAQDLWSKSFMGSEQDSNPGPLACQPSIITTRPWSFVAAGPAMWLFWISTCTNTSVCLVRRLCDKNVECLSKACVLSQELQIGFNTFHTHYRHDWGIPPSGKSLLWPPLKNRGPCPTMLKTFDK